MTMRTVIRSGILAAIVVGGFSLGSSYFSSPAAPPTTMTYVDTRLSAVLEDLGQATGVTVVVFPDVGAQRVSGRVVVRDGGIVAARAIARSLGLTLRRAGPHWAMVRPPPGD